MAQMLIDHQSPNKKFAWTTDPQKITANRSLLRSIPFANSVKTDGKNDETISMFTVGRYITVVWVTANGNPRKMYFFDYDWELTKSDLQILLQGIYSKELEKEWFNIQWSLYSTFKKEMDIVELCKIG